MVIVWVLWGLGKGTISLVKSVCLSVRLEQLGTTWNNLEQLGTTWNNLEQLGTTSLPMDEFL